MTITSNTTTVYFGGRQRYLSLDSACHAEARSIIYDKLCHCEPAEYDDDYEYVGVTCTLHADMPRYAKLHTWLSARLKRAFLAKQSAEGSC